MGTEILRFDNFELDRGAYELRYAGQVVHLERIPLDLLLLLLDRRGQLVTRKEIVQRIWGKGLFIDSDNSINSAVRKLRRALHDNAGKPRFIVAIPAKGYRFVATVRESKRAQSSANPEGTTRPAQSMFVGRERELFELGRGLKDAASGHGCLFLVSGPPGVGKTRLTLELGALAQSEGMLVLTGRCKDQSGSVPYLPFVDILETFIDRSTNADYLRSELEEEGPELARMVPKLKRLLPDLSAPLELPPEQARRYLLNCFSDFAARTARKQPTLLLLDDLQWADGSTLLLLDHLVQRLSGLPLQIVGTYRDVDPDISGELGKALEELLRGRHAIPLRLKGLEGYEVAQMLEGLAGQAPPAAVVDGIYAETDGNPFFVEELFRYLQDENRLYDESGSFRTDLKIAELEVPQSVRLVIGRRLERLAKPTQKILGSAAVIGRHFSFKVLQAAVGSDGLLDCIDEAEKAGLIFSSATTPDASFEFSHELIRQVVLCNQSAARRQQLHLQVAGAVEHFYGLHRRPLGRVGLSLPPRR